MIIISFFKIVGINLWNLFKKILENNDKKIEINKF